MRRVRGPPGVMVGVMGVAVVLVEVGVFGGTVAGSGVGRSEARLAQPVSRDRKIAIVRNLRIILNQLGH